MSKNVTDEDRELLAYMRMGQPVTAMALARRAWGNKQSHAASMILRRAANAGYVRKTTNDRNATAWVLIRSVDEYIKPVREGTRIARINRTLPMNSSSESTTMDVTMPTDPWGLGL